MGTVEKDHRGEGSFCILFHFPWNFILTFSRYKYVVCIFYFNAKSELSGLLGLWDASGFYLYFSTLKTTSLNLEDIMLSETSESQNDKYCMTAII